MADRIMALDSETKRLIGTVAELALGIGFLGAAADHFSRNREIDLATR